MRDKIIGGLIFLIALIYLCLAFGNVNDYGITFDEPQHFAIGDKYFNFYRTGHLDFHDNIPIINKHLDFYSALLQVPPFIMSPFANILSAISCYVFFQKLQIFSSISAHHIIIPILVTIFIPVFYWFVKKHWNSYVGLLAVLSLLTYPRFFGHSFNNIKDIPEIIIFSITIFLFAEWIISKRIIFLYFSLISWGLAFATKMDAVLIPVILLIWLIPTIYRRIIDKEFFNPKILLHLVASSFIAILVVVACYPPLLTSQSGGRGKFLMLILNYIYSIGTNTSTSWNLYAPTQILYVTPIIMLFFFFIGFGELIKKLPGNDLGLLLIIWLLFPIIRHSFPNTNHYDVLRHFLVFIVPFVVILSIGLVYLSEKLAKHIKLKKE